MSRQTRSSRQPSHIPLDPEPSAHITEFDAAEELTDTPEQIAAPLAADNYLNNDPPTPPNASAAHQVSPIPSRHQTPPLDPNFHMGEALRLLTQELRRRDNLVPPPTHKRAKAKEPDTFDGTEPKKLNNFILLCNLYFRKPIQHTPMILPRSRSLSRTSEAWPWNILSQRSWNRTKLRTG